MLDHPDSCSSFPMKECARACDPTILIELILWGQFVALLPERKVEHPLRCHRRRIPDRIIFERLVEVLVFGCAYSGG